MELSPEEIILEDIKEWCEANLLEDETWEEYLDQFEDEAGAEEMSKMMDIYWQDHIFPIDKY